MNDAVNEQQAYYERTAANYDQMHLRETEHEFASAQLMGLMKFYQFDSLLDVGSGTGRVLRLAKSALPDIRVTGIEPVNGLREIGFANGLQKSELLDGNALNLQYDDNSWDIVCAFGILHHIPEPERAITEMCRVAKHGVFFSDLNNYGCGSLSQRVLSQTLHAMRLWKPFQYLKNGGKFEKFSEGDGIHYSYSLFDSLPTIRRKFPQTHLTNTKGNASNLYRGCSHISVFAITDPVSLESRRVAL